MKVVVDTNIVFSAILNTNSKIGKILLSNSNEFDFYTTNQLLIEINNHKDKIKKISGLRSDDILDAVLLITSRLKIINVVFIPEYWYNYAESLTSDIDIDDTEFVALTEFIDGRLWTGDKFLKRGLELKNWSKFVSTDVLFELCKNI